jgi:glucuronokinase
MTCILLSAGLTNRLERELDNFILASSANDHHRYLTHPLRSVPKALLPATSKSAGGSNPEPFQATVEAILSNSDEGGYFRNVTSSKTVKKALLDRWIDEIAQQPAISKTLLVVNALKFKFYERWATARGFPVDCIVCNGVTQEDQMQGGLMDLELALRFAKTSPLCAADQRGAGVKGPVIVVSADMAFDVNFDLKMVLDFFAQKNASPATAGDVLTYHYYRPGGNESAVNDEPSPSAVELCSRRGILLLDDATKAVQGFFEKKQDVTSIQALQGLMQHGSLRVSIALYVLRAETAEEIIQTVHRDVTAAQRSSPTAGVVTKVRRSLGSFFEQQLASKGSKYRAYGVSIPAAFSLIGQDTSLEQYVAYCARGIDDVSPADLVLLRQALHREDPRCLGGVHVVEKIVRKSYARVGLMGNPSDQLNGKSMAVTISNFWAEVSIFESPSLRLLPHPLSDPFEFGNLRDLHAISSKEGYMGGLRLLQAGCKRFFEFCQKNGVSLPRRNFTLSYETNVPRQVGLAGSSCIVATVMKCLMAFFHLTWSDIPKHVLPSIILSVEMEELGIHAGLMDRVAQVYEGLVHMDFEKTFLAANGFARYTTLRMELLPRLHLAYAMDPSDSGKIHSTVKERWAKGDPEVFAAAVAWAGFVDDAVDALQTQNHAKFAELMDANFDLRRKLYGDPCLGSKNLRMIEIARAHSAAAKFPGSGGAILICCRPGRTDEWALKKAMDAEGFVLIELMPYAPSAA